MNNMIQLPSQIIPDEGIDEWMQNWVMSINNMCLQDNTSKVRDIECWMHYHNIHNEREFDYLTRISSGTNGQSDYFMPAKVRHIPLQRPKLNVLISQQKGRPFAFSSYVCNNEGKAEKQLRMIHNYIGGISSELEQKVSQLQLQSSDIDSQLQQFQQMVQKKPESAEEQQQIMLIQQKLPAIQSQMNMMKRMINKEILLTSDDLQKIDMKYGYSAKDITDDIAQKLCYSLRSRLGIETKSVKNFISQVTTGKQAYLVDYDLKGNRPVFESLNFLNLYYPQIESISKLQDGPWIMHKIVGSLSNVIDEYNLTKDEIKELENRFTMIDNMNDFYTTQFGQSVLDNPSIYSGTRGQDNGVTIAKVYWRGKKRINVKKSVNQYDEKKPHIHYLDSDKKILNKGDYTWSSKEKLYINKETGDKKDKKDIINTNKGESLETRWDDVIYEGVVLGGLITKNVRERNIRLLNHDDYSTCPLPIIGKSFSSISDRPYSLIWDTKDIQKLFNLFSYHRELLLATSGVKGAIMDKSQKPEGMSMQEWMYYKKLGTMLIETVKKSGKVNSSYNQFGSFDDSVGPGIQYIDNMLNSLDIQMGNIMGVGPQRQGQMSNTDQVGTYQMAIQQNSLITEIIYAEHDEIERQALELLLNLCLQYMYIDGGTFDYKTDNLGYETMKVPSGLFKNINIRLDVENNSLQDIQLRELKQMLVQQYSNNNINLKDMISVYTSNTLLDLEKKFETYVDAAQKIEQQNQQGLIDSKMQSDQASIKLKGQIDTDIANQTNEIKKMQFQLTAQLEKMKDDRERLKIGVQDNMNKGTLEAKNLDTETQRQIESAYINEQANSNRIDEKLRAIEIQLNAIIQDKKIHIDHSKAKMAVREHIKDN